MKTFRVSKQWQSQGTPSCSILTLWQRSNWTVLHSKASTNTLKNGYQNPVLKSFLHATDLSRDVGADRTGNQQTAGDGGALIPTAPLLQSQRFHLSPTGSHGRSSWWVWPPADVDTYSFRIPVLFYYHQLDCYFSVSLPSPLFRMWLQGFVPWYCRNEREYSQQKWVFSQHWYAKYSIFTA